MFVKLSGIRGRGRGGPRGRGRGRGRGGPRGAGPGRR